MKSTAEKFAFLVATAGVLFSPLALAQDEDETADLQSYSVGQSRQTVEQEKVTIERPKFENNFKFEAPKPNFSGMQIAKPKLQVMAGPEPATNDDSVPTRTAQADTSGAAPVGTSPSAGSTPGGETRAVRPLSMDPPSYPRDALRRREEGFVVVEFTINAEGRTEDINVVDAEPRGAFENEARRAVSRWSFEPALRDGRPVSQRIRHTLEFKLTN